jgi:hypothetical protein
MIWDDLLERERYVFLHKAAFELLFSCIIPTTYHRKVVFFVDHIIT